MFSNLEADVGTNEHTFYEVDQLYQYDELHIIFNMMYSLLTLCDATS